MLQIIEEIAAASGNEKIRIMKEHPEIKKVLEHAYNPFRKYYITAPEFNGDGTESYIPFKLLYKLQTREVSGYEAIRRIKDTIAILKPDWAELFKRILNKDLRARINIRSINKAFPGLIPLVYDGGEKPPVMNLRGYKKNKCKFPCLAAVKKDGVRGMFSEQLLSRQGHRHPGHEHLEDELSQYGIMTDGEVCIPGMIFDEASGRIRDDQPCPESVIYLFDVPNIPGTKMERYKWMKNNIRESNKVKIITHYIMNSEEELMKFYKWALDEGEEGIVVYDPDSLYEDKRSHDWMRLVPVKKADCPVIGFYEGKGKLENSLGGIIVDYKGHEVRVGSGFPEKLNKKELNQLVRESDVILATSPNKKLSKGSIGEIPENIRKLRKFIWDNKEQYLGAIAEVAFKEKTKAGSLRQPRFKRWRWDKMEVGHVQK